jgi:hypothetical protein
MLDHPQTPPLPRTDPYQCRSSDADEVLGTHRYYDWAWFHLDDQHHLLVRRSISDPSQLAFYRCYATGAVTLSELVRVAGSRWSIEECFQATKNEAGLDHYQVRKRIAWYRHITLAMVAHAHLALTAAGEPEPPPDPEMDTGQGEHQLATQGAGGLWTTEPHPATV